MLRQILFFVIFAIFAVNELPDFGFQNLRYATELQPTNAPGESAADGPADIEPSLP